MLNFASRKCRPVCSRLSHRSARRHKIQLILILMTEKYILVWDRVTQTLPGRHTMTQKSILCPKLCMRTLHPWVRSHAPSIQSHRGIKVVWPDFQPMRVPEEPVCIDLFRQNPVFTSLHLKSPVHVHRLWLKLQDMTMNRPVSATWVNQRPFAWAYYVDPV